MQVTQFISWKFHPINIILNGNNYNFKEYNFVNRIKMKHMQIIYLCKHTHVLCLVNFT